MRGFSPRWRVWIFLSVANLLWIAGCWFFFERETWLWITPVALSINFLLLTYGQVLNFRTFEGQPLVGNDPWGVLKTVHELVDELQVKMPKVFLLPNSSAQVFAYAKTRRHPQLFISEGAIRLLTPRQLRAVLTFQFIVIRSNYNILNYWIAAVLDLLFSVGLGIERIIKLVFGWTPPLAAWLLTPWMWLMRWTLLSEKDFQRLDTETARLLDNPEDLAQALWKMEAYAQTRPWPEPWIFAHMCMVSPLRLKQTHNLPRIQPLLKRRIKQLTGRYPL
jgi:heat shock protein HtpX